MLGQTLVLMQMTFLNNVRKVGRLVRPITSCLISVICLKGFETMPATETFNVERMYSCKYFACKMHEERNH
jgi:hypothetical protein